MNNKHDLFKYFLLNYGKRRLRRVCFESTIKKSMLVMDYIHLMAVMKKYMKKCKFIDFFFTIYF